MAIERSRPGPPAPGAAIAPPPAGRAPQPRPRAAIRAIDWSSGRPLNGRYRMLQKLGEGGMGSVFLCEDILLRRKIALKTLFADRQVTEEDLERFRREVAIAHAVNHANIARTYDLGEAAGVHYLTMEALDGETLVDRLRNGPALTSTELRALAVPLCEGLRAAHKAGIVHRDLKPANIMLVLDARRLVIMDFGIARAMAEEEGAHPEMTDGASHGFEVTSAGRGTPTYMAPEQWQGLGGDARTDVYALGVILFVCLARRAPFRAETSEELAELHLHQAPPPVTQFAPKAEKELALLIRDCLAKRPEDRPQSMAEVLERLQRGSRRRNYAMAVLATTLVSGALLGVVGLGLWTLAKRAIIREMRPALGSLAESIALQLDPADLDEVREPEDVPTDAFQRPHKVLQRYKARHASLNALYVMRTTARPDQYAFVVDLHPADFKQADGTVVEGSPPGGTYDGTDSPAMADVLKTGAPVADDEFVTDAWGVTLSGYSPVMRDGKATTYFVGADARNDQLERLKVQLLLLFGIAWGMLVVGFAAVRLLLDRRKVTG